MQDVSSAFVHEGYVMLSNVVSNASTQINGAIIESTIVAPFRISQSLALMKKVLCIRIRRVWMAPYVVEWSRKVSILVK